MIRKEGQGHGRTSLHTEGRFCKSALTNGRWLDVLIALARYYKTSADYLLGLTDERKPYPESKKR